MYAHTDSGIPAAMTRTRSLACMLLLTVTVALGACAELQPRPELPMESALSTSSTTVLDRTFAGTEASHPGEAGFRLLVEGTEAFVARMQSVCMRPRSVVALATNRLVHGVFRRRRDCQRG